MKYHLNKKVIKINEDDETTKHEIVEVIAKEEYKKQYRNHPHNSFFYEGLNAFSIARQTFFENILLEHL